LASAAGVMILRSVQLRRHKMFGSRDPSRKRHDAVLVVLLLLGAPQLARADELPDADALFEKNIAAQGGREKLLTQHAQHFKGQYAKGKGGALEVWWSEPNLFRSKMRRSDGVEIEDGFDGHVRWTTAKEDARSRVAAPDLLRLPWSNAFRRALAFRESCAQRKTIERMGLEDGRAAYRAECRPLKGPPVSYYFDVDSGLLTGIDEPNRVPWSDSTKRTLYSNFAIVDGTLFPLHHEIRQMGDGNDRRVAVVDFDTIEINPHELPSFALPSMFRRRSIFGRVMIDDKPAPAEIIVSASHDHGVEVDGPAPSARTDRRGRFRIDGVIATDGGYFRVKAALGTNFGDIGWWFPEHGDAKDVVLNLRSAGRLDVRVLDPESRPIEHARVSCTASAYDFSWDCGAWLTDADGKAAVFLGPHKYWFGFSAPGFLRVGRWIEFANGTTRTEEVRLDRVAEASGIVIDEDRRPVSGVELVLEKWRSSRGSFPQTVTIPAGPNLFEHVISDADGRFRFQRGQPGKNRVIVLNRGEQPRRDVVLPMSGIEVMLVGSGTVEGIVLGIDGLALAGARVHLSCSDSTSAFESPSVYTDREGRFFVRGVPSGEYEIAVDGEYQVPVQVNRGAKAEVRLQIAIPREIHGVVTDENGRPLASVEIEARSRFDRGRMPKGFLFASVVSGIDGRFMLSNVPHNDVELRARARIGGSLETVSMRATMGTSEARIVLPSVVEIVGRVAGPDGKPIERFEIGPGALAVVDAGGAFRRGASSRTRDIEVWSKGFAIKRVALAPLTGKTSLDLGTIQLDLGRALSGRVLSKHDGRAIAARVAFVPEWSEATASSGSDGRFVLKDVPSNDTVRIRVASDGFVSREMTVTPRDADLTIALEPGGIVSGRVVDADQRPVPGISIRIEGRDLAHVRTDQAGRFEVRDVAEGRWMLVVEERATKNAIALAFEQPEVDVQGGRRVEVEIKEQPIDVQVRALDALGDALRHAKVVLVPVGTTVPEDNDAFDQLLNTGASPRRYDVWPFMIWNVRSGRYLLLMRAGFVGGILTADEVVTVDADHPELEIRLPDVPRTLRTRGDRKHLPK
jgi:carboxypeptidase family protein